jgi:hypothetical protein
MQDVRKRPTGPVQEAMDPLTMPRQFLGISKEWGFTKLNEIFSGRVAMIGFAMTVVAETFQHRGPIAQVSCEVVAWAMDCTVAQDMKSTECTAWCASRCRHSRRMLLRKTSVQLCQMCMSIARGCVEEGC